MALLFIGSALILLGGVAAMALHRRPPLANRVLAVCLTVGAALGIAQLIPVLQGAPAPGVLLGSSLPGGPWAFGLDPLSAWFLLPVLAVGACAGIFGIAYLDVERDHRPVAQAHGLFALLLVALIGVVTAEAMVPFLAAWEVMAVSGYLLVMFEHDQANVRRAGFLYLVLTHVSTLALIAMFAALGTHIGGRSFAELGAANQVQSATRTLALVLAIIGFGLKAGAIPLHVWLPGAHAAAPSHVSAVLSGVMLKMGIYGLLRVLILVGGPPAWFGWTLVSVGLLSGVLGVLWALGERDLKRVLAYSSVENIGIILLGMGVGVLGVVYSEPAVAVLGFAGALLHSLNHALFKSLLFLGAGAVLRATGTREIDRLGGLGRQLPWTALAFGVGAVAIVGLPPLNGFVSEWLLFQGLLAAAQAPGTMTFLVLGVPGLGLIAGLALACFTRAAGGVFLGQPRQPRSPVAEQRGLTIPMLVLAAACAAIGVAPIWITRAVIRPASLFLVAPVPSGQLPGELPGAALLIATSWLVLLALGVVTWYLRVRSRTLAPSRRSETWGCGYARPAPRMQYTAGSFAAPLLVAFGRVATPEIRRDAGSFETRPRDRVLEGVMRPWSQRTRRVAAAFRPLQQGPVTRYLQYIVFTVLVLLGALFVALARR